VLQQIERKANDLATGAMSDGIRASFLALPLKDKLIGLASLAHIAGETETREWCLWAIRVVDRIAHALAAFNGQNELLMSYLLDLDGYEEDGIVLPSNGMSEARAIELIEGLSDEEWAAVIAVGLVKE
jgi:hypothetical protein